jgi:hypothetical protein
MNQCHYITVKAKLYFVVEEINTLTPHHVYMAYSKEGKGDMQQGAINCLTASDVCAWLLITTNPQN